MVRADLGRVAIAALVTAAVVSLTAAPARAQEPSAAQITEGESIFVGKAAGGTCWGCHGKDAKGTANAPPLIKKAWLDAGDGSWSAIESTVTTGVPQPKKFKVAMPPMGGAKLSPDQVKSVAAYVYSLNHKGADDKGKGKGK
jgi:mono/diheme cytochrome c family protein